jgi:hypothetical protein
MTPVIYKDEVLLYGLARYFGLHRGRKRSTGALTIATVLLALYRVKGPIRRDDLMRVANIGHVQNITFRTYICFIRGALGSEAIYLNKNFEYQLSFEARAEVDKAFAFIRNEIEEAIHPTRPAVLALVRVAN